MGPIPDPILACQPDAPTPAGYRVITGTPGNDVLIGTVGRDIIYAFAGNDRLSGGAGTDVLLGEPGTDTDIDADPDTTRISIEGTD